MAHLSLALLGPFQAALDGQPVIGLESRAGDPVCPALGGTRSLARTGATVGALAAAALFLIEQGQPERAVELGATASRYPLVSDSRMFQDVFGQHIAAAAAGLPPELVAAAQARGRARDLDATVAELLIELEE